MNNSTITVFFVSDRTGITVETLANSLLTQFEGVEFIKNYEPFIDDAQKAYNLVKTINNIAENGIKPLVFSTQINSQARTIVAKSNCFFFDFFETFISKIENALGIESCHTAGRSHSLSYNKNYTRRMDSVNFTLNTDDGLGSKYYNQSDVIMLGVSRTGKTPSCLYMSLNYGVKASNYPLTEDDIQSHRLPLQLEEHKTKLFGLTIEPHRLSSIRDSRLSQSNYSSLKNCQKEVALAEEIFKHNKIPFIDTTRHSIEEVSSIIIKKLSLRR